MGLAWLAPPVSAISFPLLLLVVCLDMLKVLTYLPLPPECLD